jgi:hypothetical protein
MSACPVAPWCDDNGHASPDVGWRALAADQVVRRHESAGTHTSYISPDTGVIHVIGVRLVTMEISNADTIGITAPHVEISGARTIHRMPPNDAMALAEAIRVEARADGYS